MKRSEYEVYSLYARQMSTMTATTSVLMGGFAFFSISTAVESGENGEDASTGNTEIEVTAFCVLMLATLSASIVPLFSTYVESKYVLEDTVLSWYGRNIRIAFFLCTISLLGMAVGITLVGISVAVQLNDTFTYAAVATTGVSLVLIMFVVVIIYFSSSGTKWTDGWKSESVCPRQAGLSPDLELGRS
eukprot:TRINITY_DN4283_c0_g1_i1.p1 TRINITY_DN4283_c0_g1~~TRINITY_DN4283_c0_g1_i1.p1  ORF type:complete len:188 (+),score=40.14 TRINITY_DN4283_c0_g1_i1:281-844(+)